MREFPMFPSEYEKILKEEEKERIDTLREQSSIKISEIKADMGKREPGSAFLKGLEGILGGGGYGLAIGFFLCVCMYIAGNHEGEVMAVPICCIVGTVIGGLLGFVEEGNYNENYNEAKDKIAQEEAELPLRIQEAKREISKKISEYKKEFDEAVMERSIQLAGGELAEEVTEWMVKGFCRTIDGADRRSHIEEINIPFMLHVFQEKISCNLGTYDFELKRCDNLFGPFEQMALARVLASAIQISIKRRYPKDASKTSVEIDIVYSNDSDYATAIITYVAPNGNYKRRRGWGESV